MCEIITATTAKRNIFNKKTHKTLHKRYRFFGTDLWGILGKSYRDKRIHKKISNLTYKDIMSALNADGDDGSEEAEYVLSLFPEAFTEEHNQEFTYDVAEESDERMSSHGFRGYSAGGAARILRKKLTLFYGGGRLRLPTFRIYSKFNDSANREDQITLLRKHLKTSRTYVTILETRTDIFFFRIGFFASIFESRKFCRLKRARIKNTGKYLRPWYKIQAFEFCFVTYYRQLQESFIFALEKKKFIVQEWYAISITFMYASILHYPESVGYPGRGMAGAPLKVFRLGFFSTMNTLWPPLPLSFEPLILARLLPRKNQNQDFFFDISCWQYDYYRQKYINTASQTVSCEYFSSKTYKIFSFGTWYENTIVPCTFENMLKHLKEKTPIYNIQYFFCFLIEDTYFDLNRKFFSNIVENYNTCTIFRELNYRYGAYYATYEDFMRFKEECLSCWDQLKELCIFYHQNQLHFTFELVIKNLYRRCQTYEACRPIHVIPTIVPIENILRDTYFSHINASKNKNKPEPFWDNFFVTAEKCEISEPIEYLGVYLISLHIYLLKNKFPIGLKSFVLAYIDNHISDLKTLAF